MYLRLIFLFLIATCFGQQPELKTLSWNENKPLTWLDFEDIPSQSSDAAALTASGISFGFSINRTDNEVTDFTATVSSLFYPEKSWYKKEVATAHILKHEQLHFDITELHARKFRQEISTLTASQSIQDQLNGIYTAINKKALAMQRNYDAETNHSINIQKQLEWETYLSSELNKLDAFKSY